MDGGTDRFLESSLSGVENKSIQIKKQPFTAQQEDQDARMDIINNIYNYN